MFTALTCPQCGGALPRQALWRTLACPYCNAMVTRGAQTVRRAAFHDALQRSRPAGGIAVAGQRYRLLARLAVGAQCDVWLGESTTAVPIRATLKLARTRPNTLQAEAAALTALADAQHDGSAYFGQRLPQVLACAPAEVDGATRDVLALRDPPGYWGSLAQVQAHHPDGLRDARHAVWLWRRALEVLAYCHRAGWTHGDLRPEHWLVHPADHGVLLIGWGRATHGGAPARDLAQSAWTIRALLAGRGDAAPALPARVPSPLADLLRRASEDSRWIAGCDAATLERHLMTAAGQAYGAPQFVPFDPLHA